VNRIDCALRVTKFTPVWLGRGTDRSRVCFAKRSLSVLQACRRPVPSKTRPPIRLEKTPSVRPVADGRRRSWHAVSCPPDDRGRYGSCERRLTGFIPPKSQCRPASAQRGRRVLVLTIELRADAGSPGVNFDAPASAITAPPHRLAPQQPQGRRGGITSRGALPDPSRAAPIAGTIAAKTTTCLY